MTTANQDHVLACVISSEIILKAFSKSYLIMINRKIRGDNPIKYPKPREERNSCVGICHRYLFNNSNPKNQKKLLRRRLKGIKKRRPKYRDIRKNRENKPCVGKFF